MAKRKKSVLFICVENSARSQMAEALLKERAGDFLDIYSAGTHPTSIDSRAIKVLDEYGCQTETLASKSIKNFDNQAFDYVITLCDQASNECKIFPNAGKQLAWDIEDPKFRNGSNPFSTSLLELNNRLSMFISVEISSATITDNINLDFNNELNNSLTDFNPELFYKSLTDTIRLKTLMLSHYHGELCVCELMEALGERSQPKISRNLAVLKKSKVITDRKHGQWVFYRLNPKLPHWAKSVIAQTTENNISLIINELQCLDNMQNRPDKVNFCR